MSKQNFFSLKNVRKYNNIYCKKCSSEQCFYEFERNKWKCENCNFVYSSQEFNELLLPKDDFFSVDDLKVKKPKKKSKKVNKKPNKIKEKLVKKYLTSIEDFLKTFNEFSGYIPISETSRLKKEYGEIYSELKSYGGDEISKYEFWKFLDIYPDLDESIKSHNIDFIINEIKYHPKSFKINETELYHQQKEAVVTDEDNCQIIAGAGSGKTLTLVAKIKYLVEIKGVNPEKICCLSYSSDSAKDLEEKIHNKEHKSLENVKVSTIHSLGYGILKDIKKSFTKINENELENIILNIINDYLEDIAKDSKKSKDMIYYLGFSSKMNDKDKTNSTFKELAILQKGLNLETIEQLKEDNLKDTFKNERVKSIEELLIANFLYINGIKYEYEPTFSSKHSLKNNFFKNKKWVDYYSPDFYLPEYNIFIEHFGVSKNNEGKWEAKWLNNKNNENMYIKQMYDKIKLYESENINFIKTYSCYRNEMLLKKLKEKLSEYNEVKFNQVDYSELYNELLKKIGLKKNSKI